MLLKVPRLKLSFEYSGDIIFLSSSWIHLWGLLDRFSLQRGKAWEKLWGVWKILDVFLIQNAIQIDFGVLLIENLKMFEKLAQKNKNIISI